MNAEAIIADCYINGTKVPVNNVAISNRVNSVPNYEINFGFDGDNIEAPITPKEVATQFKTLFNIVYSTNRSQTDSTVGLRVFGDGKQQLKLSCDGYLTAPSTNITTGNVGLGANIVHPLSTLFAVDLSIYTLSGSYLDAKTNNNSALNFYGISGTFANRCGDIVDKVLSRGIPEIQTLGTAELERRKKQHDINTSIIQPFFDLMTASIGVKYIGEDILDLPNNDYAKGLSSSINSMIANSFFRNSANLLSGLLQLLPEFGLNLICKTDGTAKLEIANIHSDLGGSAASTITTGYQSIQWSGGSKNIIPVGKVLVSYVDPALVAKKINAPGIVSGQYPETTNIGTVIVKQSPAWLTLKSVKSLESIQKSKEEEKKISTDKSEIEKARKEGESQLSEITLKVEKFLTEWAKMHYYLYAFGDSSASVSCPLDFTIEVGKLVTVKDEVTGTSLFKGYITGVTHIASINGENGTAATNVQLNYIVPA